MSIFAFDNASTKNNQTNSTCILQSLFNVSNEICSNRSNYTFICDPNPVVFSGIILTLIGLVLGLMIIIISKLHTPTKENIIFIVITMIFLDVGVALLIFVGDTKREIFTCCKYGLLVLRNDNCVFMVNILSGELPQSFL
ncbi:unnamed protein product [Schistosoma margrebowiei]|uniref:Uncharacterized protein n=1 Tax=Schistosoma margrebowiei TaxID=48269 RepID=A0AA85AP27_9TREM|nr:unnamed protein product [Schistosoma margrebowiei]